MTNVVAPPYKRMKLRYPGSCRGCHRALDAGQLAVYYRVEKQVECASCFERQSDAAPRPHSVNGLDNDGTAAATDVERNDAPAESVAPGPEEVIAEIVAGTAGASARSEYERRVGRREQRVRSAHPRLGGLILALSDEPQSTQEWQRGAVGEEKLGRSLDKLTTRGALVLHDRRVPGSRANIDHIVIGPGGVFVMDAKRYQGRPHLRVEGGILRPRVETLLVGRRDCSKLVTGIQKQVDLVTGALAQAGFGPTRVRGMLCFIDADWPAIGGAFSISGIDVLWPKKISERVQATQVHTKEQIQNAYLALARHFPNA